MADISQVKLPDGTTYNLKDSYVRTNYRALSNNDFDTINVTELNGGDAIFTGAVRFTNKVFGDNNTTYSLSASGESVVLSGSDNSSKSVSLSTLINGLSEGSSPATSGDYIIAQYAGGGTTTNTYHRRKLSNVFKAMSSNDITTALEYTPPHEPVKDIPNTPTAIATFSDSANLPMPKLEVAVEPQQDLHGYDNPWVGGAGKNKCDTHGYDGIAYNRDVGTEVTFTDSTIPVTVSGNKITYSVASWGGVVFKTPSLPSGTYHFHAEFSSTVNRRTIYVLNSNNVVKEAANYSDSGGILDLNRTLEDGDCIAIWIGSNSAGDITITNMQVESGSSYTAWQPYSNICPISGWNEAEVSVCGKNLFNPSSLTEGKTINSDGSIDNQANRSATVEGIPIQPNSRYTISYVESIRQGVFYYDKDDNFISFLAWGNNPRAFLTPSNAYYVRFSFEDGTASTNVMLSIGETAQPYTAYNGHTTTIPFTDAQGNPVTVYGGSLDLVSGVLTVDRAYVDLGDLYWNYSSDAKLFTASVQGIKSGTYTDTNLLSSIYPVKPMSYSQFDYGMRYNSATAIGVKNPLYTDATEFKTAMNGVQLCYELATPLTIQLTPTQVNSLLGVNNINANCGQITEGKYVVQDYSDITSKISEFAQLANTASKLGSSNIGSATNPIYLSSGTATACTYSLNKTVPSDAVFTDTKNTAGSTDTSSKIFLIGATSQAANPKTYSDNEVYATSGVLTTKSVQVGGGSATMQYNSTTKSLDFVFVA